MKTTWVFSPVDLKNMEKVFKQKDPENVVIYKSHYAFDVFKDGNLIARVKVGRERNDSDEE